MTLFLTIFILSEYHASWVWMVLAVLIYVAEIAFWEKRIQSRK